MPQATANNTRPELSKTHHSAVSSVQMTGLELVRKRKPRGKLATMRDYSKIDFKPWTRAPDMHPQMVDRLIEVPTPANRVSPN